MKKTIKAILLLVALAGWMFFPPPKTVASQTKIKTEQVTPLGNVISNENQSRELAEKFPIQAIRPSNQTRGRASSGRHSTRAEKTISTDSLQEFLRLRQSPLAEYSGQILRSPYWSTIIGICTIEQYECTKAPHNNYWGIGPGKRFASIPDGIEAISSLLAKYDVNGRDTIEELNCYYVQPCSSSWLNTVLKTKAQLENL